MHQFSGTQPFLCSKSHIYKDYWKKNIALTIQTLVGQAIFLLFNTLSRFAIAFLPRSKCLLISRLWSPSIAILEPQKIKSVTAFSFSPSICHDLSLP